MELYIIDRDYECLKQYESILNENKVNVNTRYFTHYSDLENAIKDKVPDIVIIDTSAPYGLISASKISEMYPKIKIILSALNNSFAFEAMNKGFYGYLKKPINIENIKKAINC